MWVDQAARDAIQACGARDGDEVAITKTEVRSGNRKRVEWRAEVVEEEPADAQPAPPDPKPQAPAPQQQQPPAAAEEVTSDEARMMAAAIRAAVQACRWSGATFDIAWDKQDIRALATTIFISRTREGGAK